MLQNMLEHSKLNSYDGELKRKYEGAILNGGQALKHQVDFEKLFHDGKISKSIRESVRSTIEFALMKAKPLMTRYHETLIQRSKEFADWYGVGTGDASTRALSNDQKNFREWTPSYNAKRDYIPSTKSRIQSNKSKDFRKEPIAEHQALHGEYSQLQKIVPGSITSKGK
jgi:hypothetical protein